MEQVLDIFKLLIVGGVVFAAAYFVLKKLLDEFENRRQHETRRNRQGATIPIRLQAYERLALLLERTTPAQLIARVHKDGMSARFLQVQMLATIRAEFDHNISQQIYVSDDVWNVIKQSKEEVAKIINIAAQKLNDNASGDDLSKMINNLVKQVGKLPNDVALEYLKKEVRENF